MNYTTNFIDPTSGFALDFSGLKDLAKLDDQFFAKLPKVHQGILAIEAGEIKNPDEKRQVTHFTDRIEYPKSELFAEVEAFATAIKNGEIKGSTGKKFTNVVINGIGGSALGPQLVNYALNGPYWNELSEAKRNGGLKVYFTDNTDSAGVRDLVNVVDLEETLVLTISKSGGTQETYNNLKALEQAFAAVNLDYPKHAAAITMAGSKLDNYSRGENWLKVLPMAESIGGRTSETSIVGHLPATLAGIDFAELLRGACHMDELTRNEAFTANPAYQMAACWFAAGEGRGEKNMVIVPYSDRLLLLSRYLQQLVMESLGKELDLDGNPVYQGLNVFGNKGGTDAHAFIQQLNDGRNDFFVTFIEILEDAQHIDLAPGETMGDYLHGFKTGLSNALRAKDRQVIEMQIETMSAFNLGQIIALYERAVAAYAEMININAFHQPGVEAYKKASKEVSTMAETLRNFIAANKGFTGTAADVAEKLGLDKVREISGLLNKHALNHRNFDGSTVSREWNGENWTYSFA